MTQRITISPNPPVAGQQLEICYDFTGMPGTSSATLNIDWTPDSVPSTSVEVTAEEPCVTITVPLDADTYLIKDETGESEDLGGVVGQP